MREGNAFLRKKSSGFMKICLLLLLAAAFLMVEKMSMQTRQGAAQTESLEEKKSAADKECLELMKRMQPIYARSQGNTSQKQEVSEQKESEQKTSENGDLSEDVLRQMLDIIKDTGNPCRTSEFYADMRNYGEMENFLRKSEKKKKAKVVLYELDAKGGLTRQLFTYDGKDMKVSFVRAEWNRNAEAELVYRSESQITGWRYTKKGWLNYKIEDTDVLVRVKPISEEARAFSLNYLLPLGYQGNNLLWSNWDAEHMDQLDYNALYEAFYCIKYRKNFDGTQYPEGIPKEEFEQLLTEYLPVTKEVLEQYAVYDREKETYAWADIGCFNYSLNVFGESIPEVTDFRENEDGTLTVTVDAVCESAGTDAYITHELTVRQTVDSGTEYLANEVIGGGLECVPEYRYRVGKE